MLACTERERLFVVALRQQKRRNYTLAAKAAGYPANSYGALRKYGCVLAHSERVIAALQEEAARRLEASAFAAVGVLEQIAFDPKAPLKDRRAAATALLDRSGHGASQNINVNKVVTDRTGAAMADRIAAFAKRLGMDPQVLLGVNAPEPMKLIEGKADEVSG